MRRVDILSGIGLLCFVALMVLVVIPRESGDGVWHGLSPYFYPLVMLLGIAAASVGLLVQALTRPKLYEDQPDPISWADTGFFLLACVLILASVFVIHAYGMWVGGPVLIAAIMVFMGEFNPLRIVAVALPTVAVTHVLVAWGLQIPLP